MKLTKTWMEAADPQIIWDEDADSAEAIFMPEAVSEFMDAHPDYIVFKDLGNTPLEQM